MNLNDLKTVRWALGIVIPRSSIQARAQGEASEIIAAAIIDAEKATSKHTNMEKVSEYITSNQALQMWGKLLGDEIEILKDFASWLDCKISLEEKNNVDN